MNKEFLQITESFDNWCKTLMDEENVSRFDSFVAYKKFVCACLTFYDVDIDSIKGPYGWNDDLTVFTVSDGVKFHNKFKG